MREVQERVDFRLLVNWAMTIVLTVQISTLVAFAQEINADQTLKPTVISGSSESIKYTPRRVPGEKVTESKRGGDSAKSAEPRTLTFPVKVLDSQGRYYKYLKQSDVQVLLDGKMQTVLSLAGNDIPLDFVFLLDMSPSGAGSIENIRAFIGTMLDELRPSDTISIVKFDRDVKVLIDSSTDRKAIKKAIAKLHFGSGTSLYDGVDRLSEVHKIETNGHPTCVIVVTDGVDTTSRRSSYPRSMLSVQKGTSVFYPVYLNTMPNALWANKNHASYPFGLSQPPAERRSEKEIREEYETAQSYLDDISNLTGGKPFIFSTAFDRLSQEILQEIRSNYFLTIATPKIDHPEEVKELTIRIDKPDLLISSKKTFVR